jgi:hypothetical protein
MTEGAKMRERERERERERGGGRGREETWAACRQVPLEQLSSSPWQIDSNKTRAINTP